MLPVRSLMARDLSRVACWPFGTTLSLYTWLLVFEPARLGALPTREVG